MCRIYDGIHLTHQVKCDHKIMKFERARRGFHGMGGVEAQEGFHGMRGLEAQEGFHGMRGLITPMDENAENPRQIYHDRVQGAGLPTFEYAVL